MSLKQKLKIVWVSANKFGYELLKEAITAKDVEISAIFSLAKTSKTVMYDGIPAEAWLEFGIPVFEVSNINEEMEKIKALSLDFIFVCGWRQMIGFQLLSIPGCPVIGFHPTLLPKGRGPAPIINSILEGFYESGITMFYLASGVDSGDIIGQDRFTIEKDDTAGEVYDKAVKGGIHLIKKYLPLLVGNEAPRIQQIESEATYFESKNLKDNEIFDTDTKEQAYAKIRAFTKPYSGAFIRKNGQKIIIWEAKSYDQEKS